VADLKAALENMTNEGGGQWPSAGLYPTSRLRAPSRGESCGIGGGG
jgi:hypothetical protein